MRLSSIGIWVSAWVVATQAGPNDGEIWIAERQHRETKPSHHLISPDAARLIIASRLGVDSFHSTGIISDETLHAVNDLGGSPTTFDGVDSGSPLAVLLSTTEGRHLSDESSYTHRLVIANIPTAQKTEQLFHAFAAQARAVSKSAHDYLPASDSGVLYRSQNRIIHDIRTVKDRQAVVQHYTTQGYDVILITTPVTSSSPTHYGAHSVPQQPEKRQVAEQPLEDESEDLAFPNETISPYKSNDTSPLRGILPACFSTKEKCQSATRNCTGHGSCTLAYTQKDQTGSSDGVACYSCSCKPSVKQNSDGSKKTTVWGGPACQKKNVVAPFWLLAGFTVLMVFLVSWGIGTIWSMGEEELPSVIGAGVSGVPRK